MSEIYSVSRLNEYVNDLLSTDPVTKLVRVKGEISGYKKYPSGHAYFQIKDEDASVRCVLFRGHFSRLSIQPQDGMQVILSARAGVYVQDGRFQLIVYDMQSDGVGALYRQYELLKEDLKKKGLFDSEKKMPIPLLPSRIGIITSPKGAVISDIIHVLSRRYSGFNALIYPVSVQGASSPAEVVDALRWFNKNNVVDVIIIARGGGSIEDLWGFNDLNMAYAIFDSTIPVISAVGHETDYTIADFVSDLRAPTPSAAAELVLPEKRRLLEQIGHHQNALVNAMNTYIDNKKSYLRYIKSHKAMMGPQTYVNAQAQRLDQMYIRLRQSVLSDYQKRLSEYSILKSKLKTLSPYAVLERGYAWVSDGEDDMIHTTSQAHVGADIKVHLKDGTIHSTVNRVDKGVFHEE